MAVAKLWNAAALPFKTVKNRQFQESIEDVFIQVEFIAEDVLYGFMFHLRALVFDPNSVQIWVIC